MYTYVDLFAGCGGLSLGVEQAGGNLLLAVEKSDMAARTFFANFIDDSIADSEWIAYVNAPVRTQVNRRVAVQPLRDVLDDVGSMTQLEASDLDVVVGGPPCQGFSLAGRRNPADIRNRLPWEYLEFVERTQPKIVVIENVVGMNRRFAPDEDAPFVQLQQALSETAPGYIVQGVAVNALHYGAPQHRPRLMIIGVRNDVAIARSIETTGTLWSSSFRDEISGDLPVMAPHPTVARADAPTLADAIGDLQPDLPPQHATRASVFRRHVRTRSEWGLPPVRSSGSAQIANQTQRRHSEATQSRFRLYQWLRANGLPPRILNASRDNESRVRELLEDCAYPAIAPDGIVLARDLQELVELVARLHTKKHSQKALVWDEPARTVVTLPDDYVHPSEPRILTVREMARLQGFPDDFVFLGKETTGSLRRRFEVPQYSQVGNAVSPLLARAVGEMIDRIMTSPVARSEGIPAQEIVRESTQIHAIAS